MCGLFGFSDTKQILTPKQLRRLTAALASASEERGTDAAGIAYLQNGILRIYKRPKAAHMIPWILPAHTSAVMGHTRMTTQGDPQFNPNNHPFAGMCGKSHFALAHNGVLQNEAELKRNCHLPPSVIQTDSYAAVQLLEKAKRLHAQSIGEMAALLKGTFSLTVLDDENRLYLVKGNNPLYVCRFENGVVCYTSTTSIFKNAMKKVSFLPKTYRTIGLTEGDILCVCPDGQLQISRFDTSNIDRPLSWWRELYAVPSGPKLHMLRESTTPLDLLLQTAGNMGFLEEDVLFLLEEGYCEEEIEAMLCSPSDFYRTLLETQYAY